MKRKAITLLEVLFAIGIVAVGILGVAMTLVLSGRLAADGQVADQADRLGRNAVREVAIRGYDRATGPEGLWATVPVNGQAYCLDPLGVAANPAMPEFAFFPAYAPAAVPGDRMFRIGVRPFPGDQAVSPVPPIGLPLAESLFIGGDDLVFGKPSDRTLPSVQQFSGSPTTGADRRGSLGAMSWFVTFQSDDYQQGTGLMQVVVCLRRDPREPERLLTVERIESEGQLFKIGVRSGQPVSDLAAREGEWIMVTGHYTIILPNGVPKIVLVFHWLRILNLCEVLPAGTPDVDGTVYPVDTRDITVFGRPWTIQRSDTQVVIPGHVVAVYEKTVRFSDPGLWR